MNKKNCNLYNSKLRSKSPIEIHSQSLTKKNCENNSKKNGIYEALKFGIKLYDAFFLLFDKEKKIESDFKTKIEIAKENLNNIWEKSLEKDKLFDEIEKINSKKCSIKSKNCSQSFLTKNNCEDISKKNVNKALKLEIEIEDECEKNKSVKKLFELFNEIEKINSKKCSIKSKKCSQSFLTKNNCENISKKDVINEALKFGIEIKDECGKNKSVKKLFNEIEKINSKKSTENCENCKKCNEAAKNGHLDCLKYLNSKKKLSWDKWACNYAAENGHLDCLQYALEHDFFWNEEVCRLAAKNGHLDCLQYAHTYGCSWDRWTCAEAARNGHLDCLQYARNNDCPWDKLTCIFAAENGHLDCLIYAHDNECPWDEDTCKYAAKNGHLDCLTYAHDNECPWDEWTCAEAAKNGHLDCLDYAHTYDCPWDEETCFYAARNGHLDCLEYAIENGCPYNDSVLKEAEKNGQFKCLEYLNNFNNLFSKLIFKNKYLKTHPFLSKNKKEIQENFIKNFDAKKFKGRNNGNREITKSEFEGLVLNRIDKFFIKDNYVEIANLNHENLEPILNIQITNDFIYFTTPFFIDKLANVLKEKSQFTKYDVSKMFCDFWNVLNFLKSKNISHGTIHENNLAFDGNNWYISGLLSTKKTGECMSGCYVESSYKSRRLMKNSNRTFNDSYLDIIPSDDMWQLVLMYVITYYGFNPFAETKNNHTVIINILKGNCKEISNSIYGEYLKKILTTKYELQNDDYCKIFNIFKNNNDSHV
jgi:hypothetical protein